jgi:hypothetical protein
LSYNKYFRRTKSARDKSPSLLRALSLNKASTLINSTTQNLANYKTGILQQLGQQHQQQQNQSEQVQEVDEPAEDSQSPSAKLASTISATASSVLNNFKFNPFENSSEEENTSSSNFNSRNSIKDRKEKGQKQKQGIFTSAFATSIIDAVEDLSNSLTSVDNNNNNNNNNTNNSKNDNIKNVLSNLTSTSSATTHSAKGLAETKAKIESQSKLSKTANFFQNSHRSFKIKATSSAAATASAAARIGNAIVNSTRIGSDSNMDELRKSSLNMETIFGPVTESNNNDNSSKRKESLSGSSKLTKKNFSLFFLN